MLVNLLKNSSKIIPAAISLPYNHFIARFFNLPSVENLSVLSVEGYQQTEEYTCGPAAVMTILHFYGKLTLPELTRETELRIAEQMGACPKVGTNAEQIKKWLENHGFSVESGENGTLEMLRDNLNKGIPTLVEWMDWGGHWSVAAGYDSTAEKSKESLLLADPSAKSGGDKSINGIIKVNAQRFKSMWFDAQYFKPGQIVKGIYITAIPR